MRHAKAKGPHYSGAHASPRRLLSAAPEQWERWQRAAEKQGLSWAEWARKVLDRECRKANHK